MKNKKEDKSSSFELINKEILHNVGSKNKFLGKSNGIIIFISYAHKDLHHFRIPLISKLLESYSEISEVFYSQRDVIDDFYDYMENNLNRADIMIFFVSEASIKSGYCKLEYRTFHSLSKTILPIFEDVSLIPPILRTKPGIMYDMNKSIEEIVSEIIIRIRKVQSFKRLDNLMEKSNSRIDTSNFSHTDAHLYNNVENDEYCGNNINNNNVMGAVGAVDAMDAVGEKIGEVEFDGVEYWDEIHDLNKKEQFNQKNKNKIEKFFNQKKRFSFKYLLRNSNFIKNSFVAPLIKKISPRKNLQLFENSLSSRILKINSKNHFLSCDDLLDYFLSSKFIPNQSSLQGNEKRRYFLIVGDAGSGKSTLIKYYEYTTYTRYFLIPLYLSLFNLQVNELTIESFMEILFNQYKQFIDPYISKEIFWMDINNHQIIIFLDGIDEYAAKNSIFNPYETWNKILNEFIGLTNAKVMVTTRTTVLPHNFIKEVKIYYEIQMWDIGLISHWLEKNFSLMNVGINDSIDEILLKIEKTYPLIDLCRNPFLLVSYIEIYNSFELDSNFNRITLYKLIIEKKLNDNYNKIKDYFEISVGLILKILRILAIEYFKEKEISLQFSKINLNQYNFLNNNERKMLSSLFLDSVKKEQLLFVIKNNSLLSINDNFDLLFSHQTFAEFLIADSIINEIMDRKNSSKYSYLKYFNYEINTMECLMFLDEMLLEYDLTLNINDFYNFIDENKPINDIRQNFIFKLFLRQFTEDDFWLFLNKKFFLVSTLNLSELGLSKTDFNNSFTKLKELDISINKLTTILDITKFPNLIKLNLSNNLIYKDVMSEIIDKKHNNHQLIKNFNKNLTMTQLEWLDLSINKLKEIPKFIYHCPNLRELNLNHNSIRELPKNLFNKISKLTALMLRGNAINKITYEIAECKFLKKIDLKHNHISIFPEALGEIEGLEILNFSENYLEKIPDTIGKLKNIKILLLEKNRIKKISDRIGNLKKCEMLYLYKNEIEELPDSIGEMDSLVNIGLYKNKLKSYPDSICNLKNLKVIYSGDNRLVQLPENIGKLKSLVVLNVRDNFLKTIPASIGNLKNLKKLFLYENSIEILPDELCNCENLENISIWGNRLMELPRDFGKLNKLQNLEIKDNYLLKLPDSIVNLINLKNLTMENNYFIEFNREIKRWISILEMRNCNITL